MPKFAWRTIDYSGAISRCVGHRISRIQLRQELEQNERYLLSVYQYPVSRILPLREGQIAKIFSNLYSLIMSGIPVDNALLHIHKATSNSSIKIMLYDIAACVQEGMSLYDACLEYKSVLDPVVLQLIKAGEESDALEDALSGINNYFFMRMHFTQQVRKALLMPGITFLFFILIAAGIFTYIVPTFAVLLESAHKDIPWITRMIIKISQYFSVYSVSGIIMGVMCGNYVLRKIAFGEKIRRRLYTIVCWMPFVGLLIKNHYLSYILCAWELLQKRGVPVTQSLAIISNSLDRGLLRSRIVFLLQLIDQGYSVSSAMKKVSWPFDDDLTAMIRIGEQSGTFEHSLREAQNFYNQRLEEALNIFSFFIQPICIFALGILVLFLVFAIYLPIIELADSIV